MPSKEAEIYALTWIGTMAGVLSLVAAVIAIFHPEGFPVRPVPLGMLTLVLFAIAAISALIIRAIRRPDLETLQITWTLDVEKDDGTEAKITRTQIDKANRWVSHRVLKVGGIAGSSGNPNDVYDLRFDGDPIKNHEKVWDTNAWVITRTVDEPIARGTVISRVVTFRVRNGYTDPVRENFACLVVMAKKICIDIHLPKVPKNPRLKILYGAQTESTHPLECVGTRISKEVSRPEKGAEYRVEWDW